MKSSFLSIAVLFKIILCFITTSISGQELTYINDDQFEIELNLGSKLLVMEDSTLLLTIDDILTNNSFKETLSSTKQPQGSYWVKFKLQNKTNTDKDIVCFFDRTSFIDLYLD